MFKLWILVAAVLLLVPVIMLTYDRFYPQLVAEELPAPDLVLVKKQERRLELIKDEKIIKAYEISLGQNPVGHKTQQGDSRTPEGTYILDWRNPNSKFFLSLHVSYPNDLDKKRAESLGVNPGGAIMIHGRPNLISWLDFLYNKKDWTDGCIAVTNVAMMEIWNAVKDGTPINIIP